MSVHPYVRTYIQREERQSKNYRKLFEDKNLNSDLSIPSNEYFEDMLGERQRKDGLSNVRVSLEGAAVSLYWCTGVLVYCFMWSGALDIQLYSSSIILYNISSITHDMPI